jgi:hypothetical protein
VSEPNSHICPECSTPKASDGTPSCACGRRASEALLQTRTAEAAAAEDFDPLRIRPYVELGDEGAGQRGDSDIAGNPENPNGPSDLSDPIQSSGPSGPSGDAAVTIQQGWVEPGPVSGPLSGPVSMSGPVSVSAGSGPGSPGPGAHGLDHSPTIALPMTTAATATGPNAADVRLFDEQVGETSGNVSDTAPTQAQHAAPQSPPAASAPSASEAAPSPLGAASADLAQSTPPASSATPYTPSAPSALSTPSAPSAPSAPSSSRHPGGGRRRRRTGIIVALTGTAVAGVMAAAGFASGLFTYDAPERDSALPDDLRASAPDTSTAGEPSPVKPSRPDKSGAPASAPAGEAPSPRPTKSPSLSSSPSKSPAAPSAASTSATPTRSTSGAETTDGPSPSNSESQTEVPKTLRLGDDDPEVTELQLRLRQLRLYRGNINENYDRQVEQAVLVYQNTRGITDDEEEEPGVYGLVTRERLEAETREP